VNVTQHRPYFDAAIETAAAADLLALVRQRLPRQLAYVAARSPFYRHRWAAAGFDPTRVRSAADLAHAPFTEKVELRQSQEELPPLGAHAAADLLDVIRIHSSSGTTGRPSYVGITAADSAGWTRSVARVYWCQGLRPEDVAIHGFGLGFFVGGLPLKDALEHLGATFVPIGVGASERLVSAIDDLGGTALTCTPSYALYLAEYLRDKHGRDPRTLGLSRIMLGAEPGGGIPTVRQRIAGEYGARITEGLGNADLVPVYCASCDENDGMHFVAPDLLLLVVIDPDSGRVLPLEDGVEGELVATHLDRQCVPLVRFRTHDRVIVSTRPCPCGRSGPRLRCVGRTDDLLIVAGVNVWPSAVSDVVAALHPRATGALQILLDAPGPAAVAPLRLEVEYGPAVTDPEAFAREVEGALRDRLVVRTRVQPVPAGALPRFEMKARLIRKLWEER
jgi:phenylacetate-CoA ligase